VIPRSGAAEKLRVSLRPIASFSWCILAVLAISRLILVAWQWDRVVDADMLASVFLQGLRFDLVLTGLLVAIPVLLFPILASNRLLLPAWRVLLRAGLPLALMAVIFMECSTPSFIDQFDSRPNILFLEYLNRPREVGATLWSAYLLPIVGALILVGAVGWFSFRRFRRLVLPIEPTGILPALLVTPFLLVICVAMIRSTMDHRPVNPSSVALSADPLANDLALNSTYTVLYAAYETRHESTGGFSYAPIDDSTMTSEVRAAMMVDPESFTSDVYPTLHKQVLPVPASERRNLVIIVEESLGAEFVGSLGGLNLTPNLDAMANDGIWFENLFATGVRSARGLEAIVTGFTPTPARSVVKLPGSQRNFFTLAQLLSNAGYDTSFIYGGESQFDNMRRFFMNNGFQHVIDESDYADPVFRGTWGVSDEDLFSRANEEFSKDHDVPFFSLVFTSSNHSPFQFPDGRVEPYGGDKNTVDNAVRYADHALGRFIDVARKADYWNHTVFLVVADHNSRVYGSEVVPIERFHIPALILGGTIEPAVFEPIASQIDLAPTLLSLIGVEAEHPMIGHDLTRPEMQLTAGRAIMQFNGAQAYMEGEQVVVLRKELPVSHFRFQGGHLAPSPEADPVLTTRALAHAAWSSKAYENSLFRLPVDNARRQGPIHYSD
jgi:phosphoglycerol transferase MdoB-like AlkP superfamily enzyme